MAKTKLKERRKTEEPSGPTYLTKKEYDRELSVETLKVILSLGYRVVRPLRGGVAEHDTDVPRPL